MFLDYDYEAGFRLLEKPGGTILYRNLGVQNLMALGGVSKETAEALMRAARDQTCREEKRRLAFQPAGDHSG